MNLYRANSLFLSAADGGAPDFGRGEYAPNMNRGADVLSAPLCFALRNKFTSAT